MTKRRATQKLRCDHCKVHIANCFCEQITKLDLETKVSLIMFKKERFLPSNTALLALNSLENSQSFIRGIQESTLAKEFLDEENYTPLYLYPTDDAQELTPELIKDLEKPINLIVPDGTWRQAKKVHLREELLTPLPKIKLSSTPKSLYLLRRQKFEFGVCTFEAISYALEIIHGIEVREKLMKNFDFMIKAHLKNRVIFEKQGESQALS